MSTDDTVSKVLDTPVILGSSEGTSEVVKIDFSPQTAGKAATLEIDGEKTAALKPKAEVTAAEVKSKLESLSNVGPSDEYAIVSATGPTGGPVLLTFDPEDGNVPAIVAAAAEGSPPTVTVTQVGESQEEAVIRGTGNADRTGDVSPLTGSSPAQDRVTNKGNYGDA